ncbi:MAG: hypothetical protein E7322_05170 [Clostridiales bacterium]|nr:hypothetical protein [Clostridiales bacterium]
MKRIYVALILLLCALMAFGAQAAEVAPGETVTVPISIGASQAQQIKLYITFDTNALEYVAISSNVGIASYNAGANRGVISMYNALAPIPGGQVGSLTLKVKESAKSGTYPVSVSVYEAYDANFDDVNVSASAGSVTVVVVCGHKNADFKVIKAPDCENEGTQQIVCLDCGEVLNPSVPMDKLGHDFGAFKETKAATCTEDGVKTAECSRCDATKTEKIDALGHEYGEWTETKAATCTEEGEKASKCIRCDEAKTEKIDALGHEYGEWTETKAATCTEEGEKASKCIRCDAANTEKIDALGHKFGEYTETKPATCTEKGEETAKCIRCDVTDKREIKELGHALGAYTVTKAATCTEKGEETAKCLRCDVTEKREIKELGHDLGDYTVTKEATCTEAGEMTSKCSRCDVTETRVIKALGHDFGAYAVTKAATCTEKGEETSKCSRCDAVGTREIKALGHSFDKWTVEVEATCTTDGLEARECVRGDVREEKVIPALGHNAVWKTIKPATNKEDGLKQKICKRCNVVLEEQIIPMLTVSTKTACTVGIKASELNGLFDKNDAWKMVTPIDLTKEGTAQYPLIAGNVYEIGYVEVTILDGVMTVELVVDAKATLYTSALILLNDASEIERFNANDYEHYEFPASINLADLESDQVFMMVVCRVTIDENKPGLKYYNFKSEAHKALIESLEAIIAE